MIFKKILNSNYIQMSFLKTGKYLTDFLNNCDIKWMVADTENIHFTIVHKQIKKHNYKVRPAEIKKIKLEYGYLLVDYYYLINRIVK